MKRIAFFTALAFLLFSCGKEDITTKENINPEEQNESQGSNSNPGQSGTVNSQSVDLGLSVTWASTNVGASKPEQYGDYYAWGMIEKKTGTSWEGYKWSQGTNKTLTKYSTNLYYGVSDHKTVLEPSDDIAHIKLGGKWRIPTDEEWTELRTKCKWTWKTLNGVGGMLVESENGNSIFLPAGGSANGTLFNEIGRYGYYWSSSINETKPCDAWGIYFNFQKNGRNFYSRFYSSSIRPVLEK